MAFWADTTIRMRLNSVSIFVAFWILLSIVPLIGLSYCLHECGCSHFVSASHHSCCHHIPSFESSSCCAGNVVSLSVEQAPIPSMKTVSNVGVAALLADSFDVPRYEGNFCKLTPNCRGGPPDPATYLSLPLLM